MISEELLVPPVFAVLGIIALPAIVLVAQLIRLGRSADRQETLEEELSNAGKYEGLLTRGFGEHDVDFLAGVNGLSPERREQLRKGRRKVLSLFLRDIWRDFHRAWSVCKLLAPLSDDPELGVVLIRQRASFYFIYALVWSRFVLGLQRNFSEDIQMLANTVRRLRGSAQQLVQSTHLELPKSAGISAA